MREIKFRAWDKRKNKWIHPDLFIMTNAGFYTDYRAFEDGCSLFDYEYELMQYTGLKDKNGKKIYEGDILKDQNGVGTVKWIQEHSAFLVFVREPAGYHYLESDGQLRDSEVIGNTYETPELLGE